MSDWIVAITGVLAFVGGLVGHMVTRRKNKTELQLALVNELQEERDRLDKKLSDQQTYYDNKLAVQKRDHDDAIAKMNARIDKFYGEKAAARQYISDLEAHNTELSLHIMQRLPPPPPGQRPTPPDGYVP